MDTWRVVFSKEQTQIKDYFLLIIPFILPEIASLVIEYITCPLEWTTPQNIVHLKIHINAGWAFIIDKTRDIMITDSSKFDEIKEIVINRGLIYITHKGSIYTFKINDIINNTKIPLTTLVSRGNYETILKLVVDDHNLCMITSYDVLYTFPLHSPASVKSQYILYMQNICLGNKNGVTNIYVTDKDNNIQIYNVKTGITLKVKVPWGEKEQLYGGISDLVTFVDNNDMDINTLKSLNTNPITNLPTPELLVAIINQGNKQILIYTFDGYLKEKFKYTNERKQEFFFSPTNIYFYYGEFYIYDSLSTICRVFNRKGLYLRSFFLPNFIPHTHLYLTNNTVIARTNSIVSIYVH